MATGFGASDLPALFQEFGVPVRWQSSIETYNDRGIVDESDEDRFSSADTTLAAHEIAVTVATASFPGLAAGATVTVDGTDYRVVQVRQLDDGALTRVWCARKS